MCLSILYSGNVSSCSEHSQPLLFERGMKRVTSQFQVNADIVTKEINFRALEQSLWQSASVSRAPEPYAAPPPASQNFASPGSVPLFESSYYKSQYDTLSNHRCSPIHSETG